MVPLTSRVGLPSSVKLLYRCPHRQHAQRCDPRWFQTQSSWQWRLMVTMGTYDSCIFMHTSADALFVFTSDYIKLNMPSWWWSQFESGSFGSRALSPLFVSDLPLQYEKPGFCHLPSAHEPLNSGFLVLLSGLLSFLSYHTESYIACCL